VNAPVRLAKCVKIRKQRGELDVTWIDLPRLKALFRPANRTLML
jgi:hypothetical protein